MKRAVVLALAGYFLFAIARIELDRRLNFIETPATIVAIDRTCADTRRGSLHYIPCDDALPTATRRMIIAVDYVSPADHRQHQGAVRCDTSVEKTPKLFVGDPFPVLAHKSESERIDRQRCTFVPAAELSS